MASQTKKCILLVEDDLAIANLYKYKLELHDLIVIHAHNGLDALKKAKENSVQLILLDLLMPVMNGEEFLQKFRKQESGEPVPVLILTNISRDEAPKTLWHFGISGYFVKANNTPAELYEKTIQLLEKDH